MSDPAFLVAILDDEEAVRTALGRLFRSAEFDAELFASGHEFLDSLISHQPDCLILDLHLPGLTGLDVLNHMVARNFRIPTVMITGHDVPGMQELAFACGVDAYLLKPLDATTLLEAVVSSIRRKSDFAL